MRETKGQQLLRRSRTVVELHDGYIQFGGQQVGEGFVRALIELADRLFPTGWRTVNGFVVPSNTEAPSRTSEWLEELEEEREAKGLNPDGTRKKKPKPKPKAKVKKIKKRKPLKRSTPKPISLKRRRKK